MWQVQDGDEVAISFSKKKNANSITQDQTYKYDVVLTFW